MGTHLEELIQPHVDQLQERLWEVCNRMELRKEVGEKVCELMIGYCIDALQDAYDELMKEKQG